MTSTSTKKALGVLVVILLIGSVSANHQYQEDSGTDIGTDFQVPQYDSHQELMFELAIPFVFVFAILSFMMEKVLAYTFADDDEFRSLRSKEKEQKRIRKYGILISLTITGMMVPSPLWDYIIYAAQFVSLAGVFGFVALFLFVLYLMLGLRN